MRRDRTAIAALCGLLVTGCGGASRPPRHSRRTLGAAAPQPVQPAAPPLHRHRRHIRPPGSLPQTAQRPSAATPPFRQRMTALWKGVLLDSPAAARAAFFPERAYVQVKAIADPQADWSSRLFGGYRLDLAAAHRLVGGGAGARLLGVRVPGAYAHWVSPGACYNRVGYWEVPNARVIYRQGGQVKSFGIASMISWRGAWYVVHLGAVLSSGVVDAPSAGAGVSVNSGTC